MVSDIIEKLKSSGLTGRGGACFPTGEKWEMVVTSKDAERYIICNASEGDPHCFKDKFLLENHLADVIAGIEIAIETIKPKNTYIYFAPHFKHIREQVEEAVKDKGIEIFDKPNDAYAHGEETVAINAIEGKPLRQRSRPPYPTEIGLFGKPTLINNVETFYWIGKIAKDEYNGKQLISITKEGSDPIVKEIVPGKKVSEILADEGISGDPEVEIGGIMGKKGKLSEVDQTLEKCLSCVYVKEGSSGSGN